MTVEVRGASDEIGHIVGLETLAIKTARISLRQHKGFADSAIGSNMTEIGPSVKAIVATRAEHEPA